MQLNIKTDEIRYAELKRKTNHSTWNQNLTGKGASLTT